MGIFTLLMGNKNLILLVLAGLLLAGTGIYIRILRSENKSLEEQKITLKLELASSQAAVLNLQSAIDTQNAAVDKLKVDSDARIAASRIELSKAKVVSDTYKKQAADILNSVAPPEKSKCDSANALINEEIRHAK